MKSYWLMTDDLVIRFRGNKNEFDAWTLPGGAAFVHVNKARRHGALNASNLIQSYALPAGGFVEEWERSK